MANGKNRFVYRFIAIIALIVFSGEFYLLLAKPTSKEAVVWKTYSDVQQGFFFQYPSDLVQILTEPIDSDFSHYYYTNKTNRVYFDFPISDTLASTTGISSTVSFGASAQSTSTCPELGGGKTLADDKLLAPLSTTTVNGITFNVLHFGGCAPADCFDISQYSTVRNGICYRADLSIDAGVPLVLATPGNVENAQTTKADAALHSIFEQMLVTIVFTR